MAGQASNGHAVIRGLFDQADSLRTPPSVIEGRLGVSAVWSKRRPDRIAQLLDTPYVALATTCQLRLLGREIAVGFERST